jgi:catechol 2,3-dioxygenase-like lactoylglutathione lyase family enzyme
MADMTGWHVKPPLEGVLETSLYVSDLEVSRQFYHDVFGFRSLYLDPKRMAALNVSERHVLLLFLRGASLQSIEVPGAGTIPGHDGNGQLHLAFSISAADLANWRAWLNQRNIPVEAEVQWERGGRSLYFRDPDGHLLELATPGVWAIR